MSWSYRVCKETRKWETSDNSGETVEYSIREAHYTDSGDITAVTVNPKAIVTDLCEFTCENESECITSIQEQMKMMQEAFSQPVVDLDTIVYADNEIEEDDDEDN